MILSRKYLNELVQKRVISGDRDFTRASKYNEYDIFLSYSFNDKRFAIKVYNLLVDCGYKVYIDLLDPRMSRSKVNKKTAETLAEEMSKCKSLLYLHSSAAKVSKWCPWELGFMSGHRKFMCATIPLVEDNESYKGQEYLNIYKRVEYDNVKNTNNYDFWVYDEKHCYTSLREWIDGNWERNKRGC